MGELSLIEKFRAGAPTHPWITVGPGSDCAALSWPASDELLFKIDQVVEGTHFLLSGAGAATPYQVGWKAMAKTCSDIAAAGGWPVAAMVAINVRKGSADELVMKVYEGLVECCRGYNIGLAGGDFSTSENGLCVSVSLIGRCEKGRAWTRGGARPGDVLMVTNALGGSLQSGKHLYFDPSLNLVREIRGICPDGVHACIDITDGLGRDLRHICDESKCGARIFESKVPITNSARQNSANARAAFLRALSDGEDFELLFAVDPAFAPELEGLGPDSEYDESSSGVEEIGVIMPREHGVTFVSEDGTEHSLPDIGYEHVV